MPETHRILLQNEKQTPLGRLRLAGEITGGAGTGPNPRGLRVYGSYAVVALTHGRGEYRDTEIQKPVACGDVFLVFPEHPHWYGPSRQTRSGREPSWDELYLTFDGPVFDLWRHAGLLHQARPIVLAPEGWIPRFRAFLYQAADAPAANRADRTRQLLRFLTLFNELLIAPENHAGFMAAFGDAGEGDLLKASPSDDWASRARALLSRELNRELPPHEVAHAVGMGYETFRKRFAHEFGVSPAHYRAAKKIEAARALLHYSPHLTNRQAAQTLGFVDEFHFSKTFTRAVGVSPKAFRLRPTVPTPSTEQEAE